MKLPWVAYAGIVAQALPLISAAARKPPLTRPLRWVVIWSAVLLGFDFIVAGFALANRNNHFLSYLLTPVGTALALWALAFWQVSERSTLILRLLIPVLAGVWIVLVLAIESIRTFSLLAQPLAGLLLLGAAIWTLLTRAIREEGRLPDQDWLWVTFGIAIYSATSVALPPLGHLLLDVSRDLVIRAYEGKALIDVLAFALIARGVIVRPQLAPGRS